MLIDLHIVYGCFHTTVLESSSATETIWSAKPKILTIVPFREKVCRLLLYKAMVIYGIIATAGLRLEIYN